MFLTKKNQNRINKIIVSFILLSILNQVIAPTLALALTSGPTAPEATSFEPIDTTDMVNPLTGDFTYNLPLLEVPGPEGGYPLSLSYHAGIQPNEDASWVGLGWTLNPGAITRSVNGFPDDWSGTNVSRRDYWDGGTRKTYSIGVSVGVPGPVGNLAFGLSFSQDTYRGFGVGMDVGANVGLGKSVVGKPGFSASANIGISPYGEVYAGIGGSFGGQSADGFSKSIGLGLSTNFESISANASGGIGYAVPSSSGKPPAVSLMGASISSNNLSPSLSVGGIAGSTSNSKAGNISTSSSGFSFGIPIGFGLNISLGYSKIRYWSDETSNTNVLGSTAEFIGIGANPDNQAFDNYALLDPEKNIMVDSDPGKLQGGSFPDFDTYSVSAQGLSGNIRPYSFQQSLASQNRTDVNNNRLVRYFHTGDYTGFNVFGQKLGFRFINDFSNSYRQNYPDYSDANSDLTNISSPFDNDVKYGNNDGKYGYSGKALAGSKSIEYYTSASNGEIVERDFIKPNLAMYKHMSGSNHIKGFKITNSSGVAYHYNLPAYSFDEEVFQEKIGGNSSNRQIRKEGYAYTWYLTAITGPDYVDRNNDNMVNEGDWGYWVDFQYGYLTNEYVWRNPAEGAHRDEDSEFQNVSMGKKHIYYLNAIKTRSHIALFEKDVRLDGKGVSGDSYDKSLQNRYFYPNGIFNEKSVAPMRLDKIYLLKTEDAGIAQLSTGVFTKDDVNRIGKQLLESKSIRIIDFNYNYDLCKGTANSFLSSDIATKYGKLTLASVVFRGLGGANLTPPVEFDYGLSGEGLKSAVGNLGSDSFSTSSASFEVGDLLETDEISPIFSGVIIAKERVGTDYLYRLKNSRFGPSTISKQVRTTKNPPYNKDAFDMWGMYKSDYEYSNNENLSRLTSEISNRSTDVWCLRKVKSSLGSEISIEYEGDTYGTSVLNNNLSLIATGFSKIDATTWLLDVNSTGLDLKTAYRIGDQIDFLLLTRVSVPRPLGGTVTKYATIKPEKSIVFGSWPVIQNINNNQLQIKVSPELGSLMSGYYDNRYGQLLTGNVKVFGTTRFYGGGIRVKNIAVNDMLENVAQTTYDYSAPKTVKSSGVTSYEPISLDVDDSAQYGQEAKEIYRKELNASASELYSIARELPAPGVMYEYVSVQSKNQHFGNSANLGGKTVYQYEVFRKNMIGRVDASAARSGYANGKNQYIKNIILKKFVGALGALKKATKYDFLNKKLSETTNHFLHDGLESLPLADFMTQYHNRLEKFAYQGLLKERFSEVKEVRESNGTYSVKATLTGREEYPTVPLGQSSKDYITGLETGSKNIEFDFYSGALTKVVQKDAYGNRFLTETVPAYRKYSSMGLKSAGSFYNKYSNMLVQEASKTVYKVDASNNYLGVVSASVQTWANDIRVDDDNGNQTTIGQSNIWRKKSIYSWASLGTSTDNITPIGIFTPYNYSGNNATSWKKIGELTRYNVYSAALEATDINNHYGSTKMGYNNAKVTVTASPARYGEIAYTGAEDQLLGNENLSTNISLGAGTIDYSTAHTGSNSISLEPGATGITYKVPLSALDPIRRDYQIKVWVKSSGDVRSARLFYRVDNQTAIFNNPSFDKVAGGWYLLEMRVPASVLSSGTELTVGCENIGGNAVINFDDFRFQPANASTTSYVYSPVTGELNYILDNSNLFMKYEYDAIGRLVKVSKEVLGKNSTVVVKEVAYNFAKPIKIVDNQQGIYYARIERGWPVIVQEYEPEVWETDFSINLYTDANCTTPYVLTKSTDFKIYEWVFWADLWGSGDYGRTHVHTMQTGNSQLYLGRYTVLTRGYWYDRRDETMVLVNNGFTFTLIQNRIDDPYRTLRTESL